ncbi:tropomyosin beta chain-like [Oscarella lobularis]|uniref:tropomyosin beta chain-like n=1 Tax=Oscarella lobularis TaxID=121494 RepID=UPI0033139AD1
MAEAEPKKTQDVIAEIQGEDVDENVQKLLKAVADSLQKAKKFDCDEALIDEALKLIRCQSSLSEIVKAVQLCFDLLIDELSSSESEISRLVENLDAEEKKEEVQNGVITMLRSGDTTAKSKSYEAQLAYASANVTRAHVRAVRANARAEEMRKELQRKQRDCREQTEVVEKLKKTIDHLKQKTERQRKAIVDISETRDDVLDKLVTKRLGAVWTKVEKLEKDLAAANTNLEQVKNDLAGEKTKLEQVEKRLIPLEANYEVVKAAQVIRSLENKIVPFRANGFLLRHLTEPKGYNESMPVSKQEFASAVSEWRGKSYGASWAASYGDIFSTLIYERDEIAHPTNVDLKDLDFSLLYSTIAPKTKKPVKEDDVKAAFEWIAMTLEEVK